MEKTQTEISKRHNDNVFYNVASSSIFNKQPKLFFVYRKSDKLAKAVYLISEHITDMSLREALRRECRDVVSSALSCDREATIKNTLRIMSTLGIATTSGCVSFMNGSLVESEYRSMLPLLSDADIELDLDMRNEGSLPQKSGKQYGGMTHKIKRELSGSVSGTPNSSPKGEGPAPQGLDEKGSEKQVRKETLLRIISSKGQVSIKDIKDTMRDVGEKTIQRDLNALYESGKIDRKGSKRWTLYIAKR